MALKRFSGLTDCIFNYVSLVHTDCSMFQNKYSICGWGRCVSYPSQGQSVNAPSLSNGGGQLSSHLQRSAQGSSQALHISHQTQCLPFCSIRHTNVPIMIRQPSAGTLCKEAQLLTEYPWDSTVTQLWLPPSCLDFYQFNYFMKEYNIFAGGQKSIRKLYNNRGKAILLRFSSPTVTSFRRLLTKCSLFPLCLLFSACLGISPRSKSISSKSHG